MLSVMEILWKMQCNMKESLSQFKEKSVPAECSVDSVDTNLTVIDFNRAFIVLHLKLAAGKSVDENNSRYEL